MFSSPLETIPPTDSHLRGVEISYAVIPNENDLLTMSPFSDFFLVNQTKRHPHRSIYKNPLHTQKVSNFHNEIDMLRRNAKFRLGAS